jgi:proline iminopeptidase
MAEGHVDVPGGRVFWRDVGENGVPLLTLHGGPGFPHDYIESLEGLADRRRVIFFDQLGCGRSDRPDDDSLWTVERFVEEVEAVRTALELERFHLFGSSWGGMLAMEYTLAYRPPQVQSLILCSSPASMVRWVEGCNELLAELPDWNRRIIEHHEEHGYLNCPEYGAAILEFYRRHVCRMDEWPDGLERAFRDAGYQVYTYMNGPTEFTVVGTLKDWSVMERLGEIDKPTLVISGEFDELRPEHAREIHERIRGSELQIVPGCSHMSFAEQPETFFRLANAFLDRVEAA